jgi:DNA-directed RNA polymerase specialized sigma24 family protein
MPRESNQSLESLIPQEPLPQGADDFARQVRGMLDGQPKDEGTVARAFEGLDDMFDKIAAGLYSLASMLVGEGEEGARLVETAIATAEVPAGANPRESRQNSRRALAAAALESLARRDPKSLAAPVSLEPVRTCIDDEDLDAASEYGEELERMIAGPDRDRVRNWLESLPTALRTIFVLRVVAGFSAPETATMLAVHGGREAAGWTPDAVRELFRQGLCSLASQLLHETAAR